MDQIEYNRVVKTTRTVKRSISWVEWPSEETELYGAINITIGKQSDLYLIHPIRSDIGGEAYALEKLDAGLNTVETYHVLLLGPDSTCECKGYVYHGTPCKHLDGLHVLDALGQLPRYRRQKHVACNHCQRLVDAPGLCPTCQEEAEDRHGADWEAQMRDCP